MGVRNNPTGKDDLSYFTPDGNLGARFDVWGRRRANTQAAVPVATAAAGAGTSPTITVTGTDEVLKVVIVAGTSPAAGTLCTIAYQDAWGATPQGVQISSADSASAALAPYASSTTSTLTVGVHSAPTGAATYTYFLQIVGGA